MEVGEGGRSHLRGTCTGNLGRGWVTRDRIRPQTAEWGAPSLTEVFVPWLPTAPQNCAAEGSVSPESLSPLPYRQCHHSSAPWARCSFWKLLVAASAGRVLGAPAARTVFSCLLSFPAAWWGSPGFLLLDLLPVLRNSICSRSFQRRRAEFGP